jgi:hypothetical protein
MTTATCTPSSVPASSLERERHPDRLADLLECLADLLVGVGRQRETVAQLAGDRGPGAREALERLVWLEQAVKGTALEASSIHQLLQHERLI